MLLIIKKRLMRNYISMFHVQMAKVDEVGKEGGVDGIYCLDSFNDRISLRGVY